MMLDSFGGAAIKEQVAPMEEQLETVKKELAVAKEQLAAAKYEHVAANHENVVSKEDHLMPKEQLARKNEELEVLRKKLQESKDMHTQLQQQKISAHGAQPVHFRWVNTNACSFFSCRIITRLKWKYLHFGASKMLHVLL